MLVSLEKTTSTIFTNTPDETKREVDLTFKQQKISYCRIPTFLGISLDRTVTFNHHATRVKAKMKQEQRPTGYKRDKLGLQRLRTEEYVHGLLQSLRRLRGGSVDARPEQDFTGEAKGGATPGMLHDHGVPALYALWCAGKRGPGKDLEPFSVRRKFLAAPRQP